MINRFKEYLKKRYVASRERKTQSFLSSHMRPMYAATMNRLSKPETTLPRYAIVIQGPLIRTLDFTLETVRLYKKTFPGAIQIISTWKDEDPLYIERIRAEGVTVIQNDKPSYNGASNINFQIVSTAAGMRRAKELGAEYVFKTRVDMRMYATNVFPFLLDLIRRFPAVSSVQKSRLIACSLDTFLYRPYSISDTFLFGQIDDMIAYWTPALDQRKLVFPTKMSILEWAKFRVGESYFMTAYLEKIGIKVDMTLVQTWLAYQTYFCVVDQQDIDLFWMKYERQREFRRLRYDHTYTDQELGFRDWLLMYNGTYSPAIAAHVPIDQEFVSVIQDPWKS